MRSKRTLGGIGSPPGATLGLYRLDKANAPSSQRETGRFFEPDGNGRLERQIVHFVTAGGCGRELRSHGSGSRCGSGSGCRCRSGLITGLRCSSGTGQGDAPRTDIGVPTSVVFAAFQIERHVQHITYLHDARILNGAVAPHRNANLARILAFGFKNKFLPFPRAVLAFARNGFVDLNQLRCKIHLCMLFLIINNLKTPKFIKTRIVKVQNTSQFYSPVSRINTNNLLTPLFRRQKTLCLGSRTFIPRNTSSPRNHFIIDFHCFLAKFC